jgi:membrane protein DedA with SNARE-associated domain
MDRFAEPVIAWAEAHAAWAPLLAFAIAFIESVPLIGIFLPGSALLLGLGLLIGAGALPAGPVLAATITGAVLGRCDRLLAGSLDGPGGGAAPPAAAPTGGSMRAACWAFRRWGAWAVFIARFISPLRAVAPVIAGVSGMRQWRFQVANIGSALVWAPLLLVPGAAAGWLAAVTADGHGLLTVALVGVALLGTWMSLRAVWARSGKPA